MTPASATGVRSPFSVRPEFVARMEDELRANQHKGDWRSWSPTRTALAAEIRHHLVKLETALQSRDHRGVAEYAADVANLSMKAHELYGRA